MSDFLSNYYKSIDVDEEKRKLLPSSDNTINTEKVENQANPTIDNKVQKFTPKEINKIESLQQELNQVTFQLGQLEISKIRLKKSEEQLLDILNEVEKKEKDLASELNKKYGRGTLDTKTGNFTPIG